MDKEYKLIICVVNRGFSDDVMDAAREAGARGGTVLHGRGTSLNTHTVFGVRIEPEKELLLIAVEREACRTVMEAVNERVGLGTPGSGICFALPIEDIIGLHVPAPAGQADTKETDNKE
jgi:nitrogen regulatory protein PII